MPTDKQITDEMMAAFRSVKKLDHVNADEWLRAALEAALSAQDGAVGVKARRGVDELEPGADHMTYGISIRESNKFRSASGWWENKIKVYGDEELRDQILSALTSPAQEAGAEPTRLTYRNCYGVTPDFTLVDYASPPEWEPSERVIQAASARAITALPTGAIEAINREGPDGLRQAMSAILRAAAKGDGQ